MSTVEICPCETFIHPRLIDNPPGLDNLNYRVGDFTTFRHALLLPLLNEAGYDLEASLRYWRPANNSDLCLQLVEWWAYIADILTFYNERIVNETYLRTAIQPESVPRLIRVLGYRPRPGIAASGYLAALLASGNKTAILPQGMGIQNKPSPGKQPQIFEVDQSFTAKLPDTVYAELAPAKPATANDGVASVASGLLLKGEISGLKPGQKLLVFDTTAQANFGWFTLADSKAEKDAYGKTNTRITFKESAIFWTSFDERNFRVFTPSQIAHLWPYPGTLPVVKDNNLHFDKLYKQISVGDLLLFEQDKTPGLATLALHKVKSYSELLWYANPENDGDQTNPPDPPKPPVAVLHSLIGIDSAEPGWNDNRSLVTIFFAWKDIGQLIKTSPAAISHNDPNSPLSVLRPVDAGGNTAPGSTFPGNLTKALVLIEDTEGQGLLASAKSDATGNALNLTLLPDQPYELKPPLKVLFNVFPVSRGKTVSREILGNGDAGLPGQEFVLKNAPLTYFLSADSSSGDNYKSTLRVWVDNVEWLEAPGFFGRNGSERIFVTREDENGKTHVLFGDGVNGARLSSGVNNVFADYRFGSGGDAPVVGSLTLPLQAQAGLKALRNPLAVAGGGDPDPPAKISRYAPRSVLTFGRAVSADDYEVIAAQAPGVGRAKAVWRFDESSQRALPTIYVGDDPGAVTVARQAIHLAADPNKPFVVKLAGNIPIKLDLRLSIDSRYVSDVVIDAVTASLIDADAGLLGSRKVGIGQAFFQSELDAACLRVNGVRAVHALQFMADAGKGFEAVDGPRYFPGSDNFFSLSKDGLDITFEWVTL